MTTSQIIIIGGIFLIDLFQNVLIPIWNIKDVNDTRPISNLIRIAFLYTLLFTCLLKLNKQHSSKEKYKAITQTVYIKT